MEAAKKKFETRILFFGIENYVVMENSQSDVNRSIVAFVFSINTVGKVKHCQNKLFHTKLHIAWKFERMFQWKLQCFGFVSNVSKT